MLKNCLVLSFMFVLSQKKSGDEILQRHIKFGLQNFNSILPAHEFTAHLSRSLLFLINLILGA